MYGKTMISCAAAIAVALSCASTSRVYANAFVNLAADDLTYFGLANNTPVPAGDGVYMGQFSVSDLTLAGLTGNGGSTITLANYATLVADFVPLNGVSLQPMGGTPEGPSDGYISGRWNGNNSAFASGPVYVLVVNSATTSGATQVGVFRGDSLWNYPANMNTGATSLDTDNSATALVGKYVTGLAGSVWPFNWAGDGHNNDPINALDLATVVPEPSSIALVAVGLLGAIGIVRRHRRS